MGKHVPSPRVTNRRLFDMDTPTSNTFKCSLHMRNDYIDMNTTRYAVLVIVV